MRLSSVAFAVALLTLPLVAHAAVDTSKDDAPPPVVIRASDRAQLDRVEAYLNSLTTVSANFVQYADLGDGSKGEVTGTFKLWRPGRLRIDYAAPSGDFIVADGSVIHQWDSQMKQASQTSISGALPGFLLKKGIRFQGDDVTVTGVHHPVPTEVEVSVRSAKDPDAGELTLRLSDVPLRLLGWRVRDVQTGVSFNASDFVFKKPAVRGK